MSPLCLALLLTTSGGCRDSAPGAVAGRQRIDRLIRQLGSPAFAEREAAHKALESIGPRALVSLHRANARSEDAEVRRRAAALVETLEERMDYLLSLYRDYELPMPPAGAKPVLYRSRREAGKEGQNPASGTLGFLLRAGGKRQTTVFLEGVRQQELCWRPEITALDPTGLSAADAEMVVRYASVGAGDGLGMALQCEARGWHTLAGALKDATGRSDRPPCSSKHTLCRMAWEYWAGQLKRPVADWPGINKRLLKLLAEDDGLATDENRALLASLGLTLAPREARRGTVEALVDGLIDVTEPWLSPCAAAEGAEQDPVYVKVAERGFELIPVLIDHLNDDRLTRTESWPFSAVPSMPYLRVGELARHLLRDMTGEECTEPVAAREWWRMAREQGEEAYWSEHAYTAKNTGNVQNSPCEAMLRLLARRHPRALAGVYRKLLDEHPDMQDAAVVDAIAISDLSREQKIELFTRAARGKLPHRHCALWQLRKLGAGQFDALLADTLDALPDKSTSESPESSLPVLAGLTADHRVWQSLERLSRRSKKAIRASVVQAAFEARGPGLLQRRVRILSTFLDDDTKAEGVLGTWDNSAEIRWHFSYIEIRNLAALALAVVLQLPTDLPPEDADEGKAAWNPDQWEALRDKVRWALKTPA